MDPKRRCMNCMKEIPEGFTTCVRCGFDVKLYERERSAMVLPQYTVLQDKYLIGKMVGQGGFGITYVGWHQGLKMKLAIKEFFPVGISSRDTRGGSGMDSLHVQPILAQAQGVYNKGVANMEKEAQTLARFQLPGIVRIHDIFRENNTAYMVMDYVEGIDLRTWMKKNHRCFTEEEAMETITPVIRALQILHQNQLLHRDISPDNLIIDPQGNTTLIDFGAARNILANHTNSLSVIIKHGFTPPEQYTRKGNQGPWTDVYAICATLLFMVTGKVPAEAMVRSTMDSRTDEQKLRQMIDGKVSAKFENALIHGLAIRKEDRIMDMEQLLKELSVGSQKKNGGKFREILKILFFE